MHALEQDALDHTADLPNILAHEHDVLRSHHHVHRRVFAKAGVHAGEVVAAEMHQLVAHHGAAKDVALSDKVRHEGIDRLVVDTLGIADLQDVAVTHDHHGVAHGERLLLVVSDVNEGDAKALLHAF